MWIKTKSPALPVLYILFIYNIIICFSVKDSRCRYIIALYKTVQLQNGIFQSVTFQNGMLYNGTALEDVQLEFYFQF
jgi:hypothetical protein